jgi:hypothetical protein
MTPEERAERLALVRVRSAPDGVYEGRERVLFVREVPPDGEGGEAEAAEARAWAVLEAAGRELP